jgi:hypothetical protein
MGLKSAAVPESFLFVRFLCVNAFFQVFLNVDPTKEALPTAMNPLRARVRGFDTAVFSPDNSASRRCEMRCSIIRERVTWNRLVPVYP